MSQIPPKSLDALNSPTLRELRTQANFVARLMNGKLRRGTKRVDELQSILDEVRWFARALERRISLEEYELTVNAPVPQGIAVQDEAR